MKLGITYLMKNGVETAETYIELPVIEDLEPLAYGEKCGIGYSVVCRIIADIAFIQGYSFVDIETIELVK